jgi:anaerobic selenocysteine-containing dehydrogenase
MKIEYCENDILSIEGDPEHPLTKGILCSKGLGHLKRQTDPDRLEKPMLKTSEGFIAISWEDAMALMTERVNSALSEHGHKSIAGFTGGAAGGKLKDVMDLFLRHLGGGTQFSGGLCLSAGLEAQTLDFGNALGHSPFDLIHAKTIVLWGKNPADTHFHLLPFIQKAKDAGAKVILVDPVASSSKRFADVVIQPLPGTDWALAMAVIQSILKDDRVRVGLPSSVRTQYPELMEAIADFDTELLYQHCGIDEEAVTILAQAYGTQTPCATYLGYGLQRHHLGGTTVRLVDLLGVLSGQIGIPGGGVTYGNFVNKGLMDWSWAEPKAKSKARYLSLGSFGKELMAVSEPPVKVLFIACGNPATQMSDTRQAVEVLKGIETVVVMDHFMTDTAELADLVLPATTFLESEDVMASNMWNSTVHYMPQVISPRGEARTELQIFSELSARLGLNGFPQLMSSQWIQNLLKPLSKEGIDFHSLKVAGWLPSPRQQDVPWSDGQFKTVDGRYHPLSVADVNGLMAHLSETKNLADITFVTRHRIDSINSQHTLLQSKDLPKIHLHPSVMDDYGLDEGDTIDIISEHNYLKGIAVCDFDVRPGVAAALQGAWRNVFGQSVNDIIESGSSDLGGQVVLNATKVTLKKE